MKSLRIAITFLAFTISQYGFAASADLVKKGKAVYSTNCTACHNADPKQDGSLGPAVYKSAKDLIEARVMKGEYPKNYKPKRDTKIMQPLPQLKNDIEALAAYLNN